MFRSVIEGKEISGRIIPSLRVGNDVLQIDRSGAEFLVTGDRRDLLALGFHGVVGVADFKRSLTALRFR